MSANETEQIITYMPYMVSLLRRMHNERALVSVRIGKDQTQYNSIVLPLSPTATQFSLDELNPRSGHDKVRKGSQLHIDVRLKGVRVLFTSVVSAIEQSDSIAMYTLPVPASMIYRQRRRHYRARIAHEQHMFISLPLALKNHIQGELVDISASGVCSRIKYTDSTRLEQEQAILAATINLPGRNHITCDLEVRSIRHFPEQGYSLVGSEFIDIAPATQTHVERVVAMLDRHHRRSAHF
jgi:c-di-GMP-binding flagellar brake protein YcgR